MSYGRSKFGLDHALAMAVVNAGFDTNDGVDDDASDGPAGDHGSVSSYRSLRSLGRQRISISRADDAPRRSRSFSDRLPAPQHPAAPPLARAAPGPPGRSRSFTDRAPARHPAAPSLPPARAALPAAEARADRLADQLKQLRVTSSKQQVPGRTGGRPAPPFHSGGGSASTSSEGTARERTGPVPPPPPPPRKSGSFNGSVSSNNNSTSGVSSNSRRNPVPPPPPKPSPPPPKPSDDADRRNGQRADGSVTASPKTTRPQHQQAAMPFSLNRRNTADPALASRPASDHSSPTTQISMNQSGSERGRRSSMSSVQREMPNGAGEPSNSHNDSGMNYSSSCNNVTSSEEEQCRQSSSVQQISDWASLSLAELDPCWGHKGTAAPADSDRRGRCLKHPMVRLYRKKLLGGSEALRESCPRCDAEAPYEELWRGRSRDAIRSRQLGGGVIPPPPLMAGGNVVSPNQTRRRFTRARSQDSRAGKPQSPRSSSRPRARSRSSSRGRGRPRPSPAGKDGSQSAASPGGTSDEGSDQLTTKSLLNRGRTTLSLKGKGRGGSQSRTGAESSPRPRSRGRAAQLGPNSYNKKAAGGGGGNDARSSLRSRSRGRSDDAGFDRKTGRCKKHPSVILAKKSAFSKGWEIIRACDHCANAGSGSGSRGEEKKDEFSGVDLRKMEELLGEGAGHRRNFGSNARPNSQRHRSRGANGDKPADAPNRNGGGGARVSQMPFTTPWGESGWYTGQVDPAGRPHGNGRMRYKTGKQYDGEWAGGYSAEYLDNQSRMMSGFGSNTAEWRRNRTDEYVSSFRAPLDSCGEGGGRGGKGVQQQPGRELLGQKMAPYPMMMMGPAIPTAVSPLAQAAQPYCVGGGQQYYASTQGISQGIMYAPPSQPQGVPFRGGQTQHQWNAQAANPTHHT